MSGTVGLNTADIARRELSQFLSTAELAGVDADRLRHSLRLSHNDWQQWLGILADEPLPPRPELPLLLRHLGYLTSRLDRAARVSFA